MNMVSLEVPSELQLSQNDIIITDDYSSPKMHGCTKNSSCIYCKSGVLFLMYLLLFPWQHDLHVATTELQ